MPPMMYDDQGQIAMKLVGLDRGVPHREAVAVNRMMFYYSPPGGESRIS